ncbi:MAG: DUF4493 domain-containing protein [Tannerellaceae bacterium]|nr:DUF4493 domain-containing protein [Tannerellaceae bacterium]
MKKYFNYLLTAILMVSVFVACDEEPVNKDKGSEVKEGTLDLAASFKLELDIDEEVISKAAANDENVDDYVIRIYNTTTNELVEEWQYKAVPEIVTLEVGNYRVEAHSQILDMTAVSNTPYYYGAVTCKIEENELTTIDKIVCTFQSIKVRIIFTDELAGKLDNGYTATVNIRGIEHTFTANELKAENIDGFIFFPSDNDDNIMIIVEVDVAIDGVAQYIDKKQYSGVSRGQYYIITYVLKGNGIDDNDEGQMDGLTLKLNAELEVISRDVNIPAEEPVLDPDPTDPGTTDPEPGEDWVFIVGVGFDIDQPQIIPKGGRSIVVNMKAEKGIKNLWVKINSPYLTEEFLNGINLAKRFDLAYPGSSEDMLTSLEFPLKEDVIDKTDLNFDITKFTALILQPGTHDFILTLIDNQNNSLTKTLSLITY